MKLLEKRELLFRRIFFGWGRKEGGDFLPLSKRVVFQMKQDFFLSPFGKGEEIE
jgi:hypothetical protein